MEEKNYTGIIPENHRDGSVINAETVAEMSDIETAANLFKKAKLRLLDVNHWQEMAGETLAHFQLTDASGRDISGPVSKGCFFKIDVPGPGTKEGDGFDWTQVEDIAEFASGDVESIGIRVRPAPNPVNGDYETAHFYSSDSTSTFTLTREGTKVTAAVYDRNLKANKESEGIIDQVRNFFVGIGGIITGSKIQWKSLTEGLLND